MILRDQLAPSVKEGPQFVQAALSPLPDWKGEVLEGPSRQAWLEKIPSSLGAACPIDQTEKRKSVIFKAPSDGTDGIEGERFQRMITRDESSFFFYYSRDSVSATSRDELTRRIKQKIDRGKCLASIF
jgi:hypothetical protein